MKVLVFGDLHVFDYSVYSAYDGDGAPDRLTQYYRWFEDVQALAEAEGVDLIVSAGDFVQAPKLAPMVLNCARFGIGALTYNAKLLMLDGQHDLDVKSGQGAAMHSVTAALIAGNDRIIHIVSPQKLDFGDFSAYARSWAPGKENYEDLKPADVFFGHGMVAGSKDPFDFAFKNGFQKEELWAKYRLSFIGDVHHAQTFHDSQTDSTIVVPGQPLQSNFSSSPNNGVYVFDTEGWSCKHFPTRDLPRAKVFHYFKANTEPDPAELAAFPNTHYSAPKVQAAKKGGPAPAAPAAGVNVMDLVRKHIAALGLTDAAAVTKEVEDAYAAVKVQADGKRPNAASFSSLRVSNFLSIKGEVELRFDRKDDHVLILGPNGSGKTSLVEALYWALTGELTKDLEVADITNEESSAPAKATVEFGIGPDSYEVVRSREAGSLLSVRRNGTNITKASAADTQKLVYDVLGFDKGEINSLLYFSLNEANLFSSMSVNAQLEFIGRLGNVSVLDAVKDGFKAKIRTMEEEVTATRAQRSTLQAQVSRLEAAAQQDEAAQAVENTIVDVSALKAELATREAALEEHARLAVEASARRGAAEAGLRGLDQRASKDSAVKRSLQDMREKLAAALERQKRLKAGHCHACGQHLPSPQKMLDDAAAEIAALSGEAKRLAEYVPTYSEVERLHWDSELEMSGLDLTRHQDMISELKPRVTSLRATIESESTGRTDYAGRAAFARQEAAALASARDALPSADALDAKVAEYRQVLKLLERSNKNPVYTGAVYGTYLEFIRVVNDMLEEIGLRASLSKTYSLMISEGGSKERGLKALSGGEKRIVDYVIMIALNEFYRGLYGLESGLLGVTVFDETLAYLDSKRLAFAHSLLTRVPGVTISISNDEGLQPLFDSRILVTKDGAGSHYEFLYSR